jgi:hypothetical protein
VDKVALNEEAQRIYGCAHAYEHGIRLLTGRTHQIRAQMAAIASPLLGDVMYQTLQDAGIIGKAPGRDTDVGAQPNKQNLEDAPNMEGGSEGQAQHACKEAGSCSNAQTIEVASGGAFDSARHVQEDIQAKEVVEGKVPDWIWRIRAADEQDTPLGLQAARLTLSGDVFGTETLVIDAGEPWWRA